VDITVQTLDKRPTNVVVEIQDEHGEIVSHHQLTSDTLSRVQVPSPKLWSPDSPTLYNITVTMENDTVKSYTGFRTISSGWVNGIKRPLLNGKFVFQFGPLDQGYWPDGIHLAPTWDAMVYDIDLIKDLGMNMVRKHVRNIEPSGLY